MWFSLDNCNRNVSRTFLRTTLLNISFLKVFKSFQLENITLITLIICCEPVIIIWKVSWLKLLFFVALWAAHLAMEHTWPGYVLKHVIEDKLLFLVLPKNSMKSFLSSLLIVVYEPFMWAHTTNLNSASVASLLFPPWSINLSFLKCFTALSKGMNLSLTLS